MNDYLPTIVRGDLGFQTKNIIWSSRPFTLKGENFASKIEFIDCQGILCKSAEDQKESPDTPTNNVVKVSYVTKLNPCRPLKFFQDMSHNFFGKEGRFLTEIVPILNLILKKTKTPNPLQVPQCMFVNYKSNEEVILMKNLEEQNYKMVNKMEPLNVDHLHLAVKELARLHASSYVYSQKEKQPLLDLFPYMKDWLFDPTNQDSATYRKYIKMRIVSAVKACKETGYFPEALPWLSREHENGNLYSSLMNYNMPHFKVQVLCHGDCWSSNFLFKYEKNGKPKSVMLIDFQVSRISSPMTDIQSLLMTSTDSATRRTFGTQVLITYFETFTEICQSYNQNSFTFMELLQNYYSNTTYGVATGIVGLPMILQEEEQVDSSVFDDLDEDHVEEFFQTEIKRLPSMLKSNQALKKRFGSMFETACENEKHLNYRMPTIPILND